MKNDGFNRIYNVLDYKLNNVELLNKAYTIISNKDLIQIGDELINKILKEDIDDINIINELKSFLWLPVHSFDLLEYLIFDNIDLNDLVSNDFKVNILKSIIGAIYLDSNENIEIVRNSFYSVFDIDLELLNQIKDDNYIYYLRMIVYELTLDEHVEEYIDIDNSCILILDDNEHVEKKGTSRLSARYIACKSLFDRLLEYGYMAS